MGSTLGYVSCQQLWISFSVTLLYTWWRMDLALDRLAPRSCGSAVLLNLYNAMERMGLTLDRLAASRCRSDFLLSPLLYLVKDGPSL